MKGILFKPEMALAVRQDRKTQTRRVVNPRPTLEKAFSRGFADHWMWAYSKNRSVGLNPAETGNEFAPWIEHAKYRVGEAVYIRESYYQLGSWKKNGLTEKGRQKWAFKATKGKFIRYPDELPMSPNGKHRMGTARTREEHGWHKRNAMFMPEWAARTFIEITAVKVERLQDISEEDAKAEGISVLPLQSADDPSAWWQSAPGVHQARSPVQSYKLLWNSINKPPHDWAASPWVFCYTFKRVQR